MTDLWVMSGGEEGMASYGHTWRRDFFFFFWRIWSLEQTVVYNPKGLCTARQTEDILYYSSTKGVPPAWMPVFRQCPSCKVEPSFVPTIFQHQSFANTSPKR